MARGNIPFLSFNRGLVSPKALGRVDLDRTKLSAEVYTNWLPKTQGAMTLRPGTQYFGSSLNDSGAEYIEFVSSTDDVALLELTDGKMRVWLGEDAHELALLSRPKVDTTVSLSDTGWSNASTGGSTSTSVPDLIPTMTAATTSGVTISASSENAAVGRAAWKVGDDDITTFWQDTGNFAVSSLPSWVKVDFGAGNTKTVASYSVRAGSNSNQLDNAPRSWDFQGNDVDTGSDASWTTLDTGGDQTGWALSEKRTFSVVSPQAFRFYRINVKEITGGSGEQQAEFAELELFAANNSTQARFSSGQLTLNANAVGSRAIARKRVIVSDTGTEHSLAITVQRGPVVLRVGSTSGDDDYVSEASLGTGYHNLAFTPSGNFHITLQSDALVNRIVSSLSIGDSGTMEVTAPWEAADLDSVRYDQSADIVYVDCDGVRPSRIERRGTGRSWSVVDYAPNNGPFLSRASSTAKLTPGNYNITNSDLTADTPFFTTGHVGAIFRLFHEGQNGVFLLGALNATTDVVKVTGIADTGTPGTNSERRIVFGVSGTWAGSITIERSFDGDGLGFKAISSHLGTATDTGTFTTTIDDPDDNITAWYRARITAYTSGAANVNVFYGGGGKTGICRVTDFNSNTSVNVETIAPFSRIDDSGYTNNWQEGYWSDNRSFPTAVALHGGRLFHANGGNLFGSVSDDYENFNQDTIGDAGPIVRTLGSGPVDSIHYLASLLRLIIGTAGAELALTSSSLDEPVTPSNSNARGFSTQGGANLRAVKLDTRAIMVQRSRSRILMLGPGSQGSAFGDYESLELTLLVPDLLLAGIVSIAIQRQPDTRIHCVLADGRVAILTYEPQEEVLCWSMWETDTGTAGAVEKAMVLPAVGEDAVYYHVRRTVNGATKRYLEKWAMESECEGDTGLTWLMDCARSYTDTGRSAALTDIATHLVGESLVVWSDDTGSIPGVDRSPDVNGVQTRYTADTGGDITLTVPVHHAVAGLPYKADWKSTKLAYAAEAGTALTQMKRTDKIAFVLYKTHNNGLFYGSDSGHLDPLPRSIDAGGVVDADKIFEMFDKVAMAFPGLWDTNSRIHLRAKSPRPCTVLAAVPTVQTNERV